MSVWLRSLAVCDMRMMKSSGIVWAPEIPKGWDAPRTKDIFEIVKRIPGRQERNVLSITQQGLRIKDIDSNEGQQAESYEHYQLVLPNDFAMNHMDLLTGWVDCSNEEGVTSPDYRVFRFIPGKEEYHDFFKRVFQLCYSLQIYYQMGQGVSQLGRWRLPTSQFQNMRLPVPPSREQRKIADLLSSTSREIDALITDIEDQMETLKQYKRSVITEVVTKGLDPSVPMKDSGVEWIGMVPEHWITTRLRYLIADYKAGPFGSSLITDRLNDEGEILVYTPEHIAAQTVSLSNNQYLPVSRVVEMAQFFVSPGEVIFPIVGSLGRAMVVSDEMPVGIINQRLAKFAVDMQKVHLGFFLWVFAKGALYEPYLEQMRRGSIIVNLTKTIVYDMPFFVPPLDEQVLIERHLNQSFEAFSASLNDKSRQIEVLKDYKNSLIYEYVTGKKTVKEDA